MSNEIQLALNSGLPAQAQPWTGGALGSAGAPEKTPLHKVHRLLRGRYLLAIVLALLGAAVGAAAGYLSQKPAYKSSGLLEIDPKVGRPGFSPDLDKVMVMATSYMQSAMAKLSSEKCVRYALKSKEWQRVRPNRGTDGDVKSFADNLTVGPPKGVNMIGNTFIQVSWSDTGPDAQKVAPVAVAAVIQAYQDLFSSEDSKALEERINRLLAQQKEGDDEIQSRINMISALAHEREDDPLIISARSKELIEMEKQLREIKELLAQAEDDIKAIQNGTVRQYTPEDWARVDPTMQRKVEMRNELMQRIESLTAQLGEKHPVVDHAKQDLAVQERGLALAAEKNSSQFLIRWKADGTGGVLIPRDLTSLREIVARKQDVFARETAKVKEMRTTALEIGNLRDQIATWHERLKTNEENLRDMRFQKEYLGPGRVRIISTGELPQVDKDRRPVFAALGFMGGAGLPIGLLLLIGLLDSRYRFSDETGAHGGMGGLTLLGILPNLPDRLSDPEQAAIAAHCVHQIRTMLQINGAEERRVFAVTSASPGDGKTSLTLAMGLSYAACGTRTLLIDCDLIGAGLSSRMNVNAAEGVLEAIANRNLLAYVRQTDIADVALLPVGSAGNLHASTLSPAALRRLIEEAEKHFETILIDTGPILGSIEASLVCAAADATVLVVARGQQRPMVEKSLSHLTSIGARLAGVVFNRAQAHDFERSISGVSMRSVGLHGPRSRSGRFGPIAKAVAPHAGANGDGASHLEAGVVDDSESNEE